MITGPGRRDRRWLHGAVVTLALGLASCGGEGKPQEQEPVTAADGCISTEQFFLKEVWTPIIERQCYNCHNPQGAARDSKMVYQPPGQAGFLEANLAIFAEMATYERSGQPLLLAKPLGRFDHGGGTVLQEDSADHATLQEMLGRLEETVACREDLSRTDFFDGVAMLSPREALRKTSLHLVGRLPTPDEEALVDEAGAQGLEAAMDRMMREEAFFVRLEEIFNDLLLTDRYLGRTNALDLLDEDFYPDARWFNAPEAQDPSFVEAARLHTNDSVAREPLRTVSYLVKNDLPFTELLTGDYMVVNPFSAAAYGIEVDFDDPLDPTELRAGQLPGVPHAGVLTSPMFLNRFPTTDTNRNRHRARIVYNLFMATDVLKLAERPIDPTSEVHNPTLNDPQCSVCHAVVDPVAGAFQNWDARGNYNPPEAWYAEMRSPGFGKEAIPAEERLESLAWLSDHIASDHRFDLGVVHIMFKALTGQAPIDLPRTEDAADYDLELEAYTIQRRFLDNLAEEFRANKHNLKIVIKGIIQSPWFQASNFQDELPEERRLQLARLGTGRMLTPEMLSRRIEAITGAPWRPRADRADYLLDPEQYRMLYGGIDSNDVVERITDPNGIMVAIQRRMSNEVACAITAQDFTRDTQKRRFFPHIEATYVPEDQHGFAINQSVTAIRKNIQHLHWHFLGERLALNDPEIDHTYQLFYDTWKEGRQAMADEALGARLPNPCQATRDPVTGRDLADDRRLIDDPDYTVRAWMAVLTYMMRDYRFLYE